MVVGGVPVASDVHAQLVAQFSLGMIEKSQEVMSPATGKPLQVCDKKYCRIYIFWPEAMFKSGKYCRSANLCQTAFQTLWIFWGIQSMMWIFPKI